MMICAFGLMVWLMKPCSVFDDASGMCFMWMWCGCLLADNFTAFIMNILFIGLCLFFGWLSGLCCDWNGIFVLLILMRSVRGLWFGLIMA